MPWFDLLAADAGSPEPIGLAAAGRARVVTLSRPDVHNALNLDAWRRLADCFLQIGADPGAHVVVVRGAGEHAFSAGADISEFPERRMPAATAHGYNAAIAAALEAVMACPVPVLAMIRGLAVGGGCELAAACDLRLATDDARLGVPIGRLGVTLGPTEARALTRLIGSAGLKDLVFSGRLVSGAEAKSMGLVDRVVAPGELVAATAELADRILAAAPITIRAAKLVADLPAGAVTPDSLAQLEREAFDGPDLREGVEAFLARREPRFEAAR
jgi:enoyl-CoA hydratase